MFYLPKNKSGDSGKPVSISRSDFATPGWLDRADKLENQATGALRSHHALFRLASVLSRYRSQDLHACTRLNMEGVPAVVRLVDEYSQTTQARVFYNIFQAYPRAMFYVNWKNLVVSDEEFAALEHQNSRDKNIRINFLNHKTLDKLKSWCSRIRA